MNMEEFNHLQNQIDDVKNRVLRIEQGKEGFQPKTCPSKHAESGSCEKCFSESINQTKH